MNILALWEDLEDDQSLCRPLQRHPSVIGLEAHVSKIRNFKSHSKVCIRKKQAGAPYSRTPTQALTPLSTALAMTEAAYVEARRRRRGL